MRIRTSLLIGIVLTVMAGSSVTGQTPEASPGSSPWAAGFADARTQATTERQQEILADDQITQAEYDELKLAWAQCMTGRGFSGELIPDPNVPSVYQYISHVRAVTPGATPMTDEEDVAAFNAADAACSPVMGPIEPLSVQIVTNPDNEDWVALQFACVMVHDLVPRDMTLEEYEQADQTGNWPDGVNIFSDQFATCFVNPLEIRVDPEATPIAP